ncbi:hypothetical protein SAMN05216516_10231 [Izhakiella capsodis]|uniref:Uncharacterized protein n=1 Tax=Izhakiella capsodis TaxID=1367852 RepID=A0A1I4VRP2_9GAMM|nr:hypothetical protein SAMN05216516_10231 [Izhakiella capsodis]
MIKKSVIDFYRCWCFLLYSLPVIPLGLWEKTLKRAVKRFKEAPSSIIADVALAPD